uniref:Uncharacterized protein n=1 Tax=Nothoprocta perdicaria TaxID=30464 RepID=A0A8C6Z4S3_NOTPE
MDGNIRLHLVLLFFFFFFFFLIAPLHKHRLTTQIILPSSWDYRWIGLHLVSFTGQKLFFWIVISFMVQSL